MPNREVLLFAQILSASLLLYLGAQFAESLGYSLAVAAVVGMIVADAIVGYLGISAAYGAVAAALATAAISYLVGTAVRSAIGSSDAPDMGATQSAGRNITIRQ